ncbi:MAG: M28 family peptidase, partial [Saprospiraceae bacterium]|nr:M28 family peptidase [Saprospiraceae bacterium]
GTGTSPLWKETLPKLKVNGIKIQEFESGVGASDHTSFYLENLPVLHFFTGSHEDYHKPSDDSERINFQGILDVTEYIFELIQTLDSKPKLAFTKTKDEQRQAASFKVTLGVMPDYTYSGQGMRVDAVLDDRPGQAAGIEKGDVIIQLGDLKVKDIYDYMNGLGQFEKGQETTVVVKRGDKEFKKKVVF